MWGTAVKGPAIADAADVSLVSKDLPANDSAEMRSDSGIEKEWTDSCRNVYRYSIDGFNSVALLKCTVRSAHVDIPDAIDGCMVTSIGEGCFANQMSMESISFPSNLLVIKRRAFEGCICLRNVRLPNSLAAIEEEAFFNCNLTEPLLLPANVSHVGSNITGARTPARGVEPVGILIDKNNENLVISDDGVIYERCPEGLIAADGSLFTGKTLALLKDTVAIADYAFSSSRNLSVAKLPEGLRSIGNGAFRGCTWLSDAKLPHSLEHVGKGAFSCTSLRELNVPASCVDVAPRAFEINPVIDGIEPSASGSSLCKIAVDEENPLFTMIGDVLCKRLDDGCLEAVVCTNSAREICLNSSITCIAPGAFSCTTKARLLRVVEGTEWHYKGCLLAHNNCDEVEIEFKSPISGKSSARLETPKASAGRKFMQNAFSGGRVEAQRVFESYDAAVLEEIDKLSQAKHMAARLSFPVCLSQNAKSAFYDILENELISACVQFGARNYWQGFDHLVDGQLINNENISEVISALNHFNDAASVAYLLELKRNRFGKAMWDFDL